MGFSGMETSKKTSQGVCAKHMTFSRPMLHHTAVDTNLVTVYSIGHTIQCTQEVYLTALILTV